MIDLNGKTDNEIRTLRQLGRLVDPCAACGENERVISGAGGIVYEGSRRLVQTSRKCVACGYVETTRQPEIKRYGGGS